MKDLRRPAIASKRLLVFGSLFGSTRIALHTKRAKAAYKFAEAAMVLKNSHIDQVADEIVKKLGGNDGFTGVHLRINEGIFKVSVTATCTMVWLM